MKLRDGKSPKKKPYHRPRLMVYGDLRKVTQSIGTKAAPDNITGMVMDKS
ncbi:MAG: hypothetical protein GTO67_14750 [Gammaproteobacteria bacterium]|nr:hypothetical protein [Gammaproteobacteria bacterium]NIM72309.1 hypothetical protein [Gammaproteobacteria bacterium]NIN39819.1 hypothetical protein [Gammaproteobacteria bacterium]NIO24068.1 hypothetical protein [Gammaproteobacteria bacterium]NIO64718.1 hypothetical protein [Gammaproteobacteria bacterium]